MPPKASEDRSASWAWRYALSVRAVRYASREPSYKFVADRNIILRSSARLIIKRSVEVEQQSTNERDQGRQRSLILRNESRCDCLLNLNGSNLRPMGITGRAPRGLSWNALAACIKIARVDHWIKNFSRRPRWDFRMPGLLRAIVLYGALNAAAYSCLLPLWEGFDEGFHYGYVQWLSTTRSFPVLGKAFLSQEIWSSYELTPVSHYLQPYTRAPLNFTAYFAMPRPARDDLRHQLVSLAASQTFELE